MYPQHSNNMKIKIKLNFTKVLEETLAKHQNVLISIFYNVFGKDI
jgi:hypothetical protein